MEGFFPAHSTHCPLWGAKPARICPRPRVWSLGFMSGTPCLAPRAYKACVGRFSNRRETKGVKPQRGENPKDHARGRGQILAGLAPQRGQ